MAVYFLFGRYTAESTKYINAARTRDAVGLIEKYNGQITAMYGLLGDYDLVFVVNLPGNQEALQVSIELARLTGIHFSTSPAITIDRFDQMLSGGLPDFPDDLGELDD